MRRSLVIVLLAALGASSAFGEEATLHEQVQEDFSASLAASRARAGDTLVNGTMNVLVEPDRLASDGVVHDSDQADRKIEVGEGVRTLRVVLRSDSRTVIKTSGEAREVALLPVMSEEELERSRAAMPLGVIVLSDGSARSVEVKRTTMLSGVVVRRDS